MTPAAVCVPERARFQAVEDGQIVFHVILNFGFSFGVAGRLRLPVDEHRVSGDGDLCGSADHRGHAVIAHPCAVGGADHHRRLVAAGNGDPCRGASRRAHAGHIADVAAQGESAGRPVHVHLSAQVDHIRIDRPCGDIVAVDGGGAAFLQVHEGHHAGERHPCAVNEGPAGVQVDGGAAFPVAHREGETVHRLLQAADLPRLVGNCCGEAAGRHLQRRNVAFRVGDLCGQSCGRGLQRGDVSLRVRHSGRQPRRRDGQLRDPLVVVLQVCVDGLCDGVLPVVHRCLVHVGEIQVVQGVPQLLHQHIHIVLDGGDLFFQAFLSGECREVAVDVQPVGWHAPASFLLAERAGRHGRPSWSHFPNFWWYRYSMTANCLRVMPWSSIRSPALLPNMMPFSVIHSAAFSASVGSAAGASSSASQAMPR